MASLAVTFKWVWSWIISPIRFSLFAYALWRNKEAVEHVGRVSTVIRDYICEMQGALAKFQVNGAQRHKTLRLAHQKYENDVISHCELEAAKLSLDDFLTRGMGEAAFTTFSYLEKFYKSKNRKLAHDPRFCIKLQRLGEIYTYDRHPGSSAFDVDGFDKAINKIKVTKAKEENTGFFQVLETGLHYLQNNIPKEAKNARYVNPRLKQQLVTGYSRSLVNWLASSFTKTPDWDWAKCWKEQSSDIRDHYKSTLIVPISISKKHADREFVSTFAKKRVHSHTDINFYGFLCIDCHEQDFFDDNDVAICYIFSDLFSLFLIQNYSLGSYSDTAIAVEKVLSVNTPEMNKALKYRKEKNAGKKTSGRD